MKETGKEEADRILTVLADMHPDNMTGPESEFVGKMLAESSDMAKWKVSSAEVAWLREIKSKYAK